MKAFLAKYKEAIVVTLFFTLLGALVYFVVFGFLKNISVKGDNIQEEILIQEGKKKRLESIPAYREKAREISAEKEKLNVFTSKENALALIEELEAMSQKTGVQINISIDEKNNNATAAKNTPAKKDDKAEKTLVENLPNQNYLSLKMDIFGEYPKIMDFVKKMENMRYMNDMISLQISQANDEEKEATPQREVFGNNNQVVTENMEVAAAKGPLKAIIGAVFYLQP